tara:strand:+ start:9320 stop:10537 length:1218 start_codon:yes stop_codon:yes gene_type:complete
MKKLIILFLFIPSVMFAQVNVANSILMKIANDTIPFGSNLSVGTEIYDIANDKLYGVKAKLMMDSTITTAAASLTLINTGAYSSVNAATEITTTSTTDVVASGMTLTPGVGTYSVMFNGQYISSSAGTTERCTTALSTAYAELVATTTTNTHAAAFGGAGGETLTAGVYALTGAGSISGTLNLSGSDSDVFIFKIHGALTTAAGTTVNLINGAQARNVFWVATSAGAMTIAASTAMKGTLFAFNAAASLGSGSTLEGRLFTNSGAITVGPNTISTPSGTSPINLGELYSFALFSSSGAVGNAGTSTITGNLGTNFGAVTGFGAPTLVNGSIFTPAGTGLALATFSIYQNGVLITNSSRTRTVNTVDISLQGIATVTDGQAIDIRWKTSLGILKLQNRILTLIEVR